MALETYTSHWARHDSLLDDTILIKPPYTPSAGPGFFDLPPEVRTQIYDLVFPHPSDHSSAFVTSPTTSALELSPTYRASTHLAPLLVSRQFHADAHLLAFSRVLFVITNPYISLSIGQHMTTRLPPRTLSALRHVAFVADSRHFRKLRDWRRDPFGVPGLRLTELTVVLRRSSYWHYLFDFNAALVALLRELRGVQRLTFVRNDALIKGSMRTWYNRLVKLMLKTDMVERFERCPANPEKRWWGWEHCGEQQRVSLRVEEGREDTMQWEAYDRMMAPLWAELLASMEEEEYDPDPMSRVSA